MSARRTNAQIDADALRAAAEVLGAYGGPAATRIVLEVIADSIETGRRSRRWGKQREEVSES